VQSTVQDMHEIDADSLMGQITNMRVLSTEQNYKCAWTHLPDKSKTMDGLTVISTG
jgi:hypothetical protein